MVTINEYRAEIFKLAGFGFFTPLGKVILSIPNLKLTDLNFQFYLFFCLSLLFTYFAIILILKGYEAIERNKNG